MPDSKSEPLVGGQGFPAENRDGSPALVGPDDYTKQTRINRILQNNTTVLTGNYADLQRAGAEAATGDTSAAVAAVDTGPGVDLKDDKVITPAQHDADKGEFTRETLRTGLLDAPPESVPAENSEPNVIDPTSQSPQVEGSKSSGSMSTSTTSTAAKPSTPAK